MFLWGVYSIAENRVLFEPQFLDIDFLDDGTYKVGLFDEKLNRNIKQLIDKTGSPVFKSTFTSLYGGDDFYRTMIRESDGKHIYGLIDKLGNEILPCKYEIAWNGLLSSTKRIIFKKDEKLGLMTFDEKIIIEPLYTALYNENDEFFHAKIGGKENLIDEGREGLLTHDGGVVLPIIYERVSVHGDLIIAKNDEGSTLFSIIRK
jgi:hypothetical protein